MCEMVERKTNMSDKDIWKIIVDNTPLFYHFCRKRKLPRHMFNDLVTETQLLVFRRLKAGDLNKGSLSHIISFAVRRTSYQLYSDLVSSAKIPTTVYSKIGDICRIMADHDNYKGIEIIRDRYFPRLSLGDMAVVINSMYKLDQRTLPRNRNDEDNPYNNWIETCVASDIKMPEDSIRVDILEIISEHKGIFTGSCEHAMYAIGRRYGLEEELSSIYPNLFRNNMLFEPDAKPSYSQIGKELGISAGSVRNHEMRAIEKLHNIIDSASYF